MPRTTARTDRSTPKQGSAWPNGLRLLASLFFLYVVFNVTAGGALVFTSGTPTVFNTTGQLWLPLLLGAAVLSSIALFFYSIGGLLWKTASSTGPKLASVAAFTLVALTVTAGAALGVLFWLTILGFIISWAGAVAERE